MDLDGGVGGHLVYGLAWISFGLGHSVLAGDTLKRPFGGAYRVAFNVIAALHLAAVFALGWAVLDPAPFAGVPTAVGVLHAAAWLALLASMRDYDLGRFSGLAQWRAARAGRPLDDDDGPMVTGPLHRYVRHPVYAAAFLVLWTGALSPLGLATAVWGSLYLLAGTASEERRLVRRYGDAYAGYRARVPAFVPWKGRAL